MSKRILITGASRGIGRAIALKLGQPGNHLILHGRDKIELETTWSSVLDQGAEAEVVFCDLADSAHVVQMAQLLAASPIDIIVHNAGIAVVRPYSEHSLEDWQKTVAVNITAPFLLTKILAPAIPRGGSIINILSIAAKVGFPDWSSYCMSKAALDGFSKAIREELRPNGVRVINIYPASTDTEIWRNVPGEWPRERMMSPESVAEAVAMALAQPDNVLVEDISLGPLGGTL